MSFLSKMDKLDKELDEPIGWKEYIVIACILLGFAMMVASFYIK